MQDRDEVVKQVVAKAGPLREGVMQKAFDGTASPRQAIKAKCLACVNFEDATRRIKECSVYGCPIWRYRPFQQATQRS